MVQCAGVCKFKREISESTCLTDQLSLKEFIAKKAVHGKMQIYSHLSDIEFNRAKADHLY